MLNMLVHPLLHVLKKLRHQATVLSTVTAEAWPEADAMFHRDPAVAWW